MGARFHIDWDDDGDLIFCGPCNTCKTFLTGVGCEVWKTKKVAYIPEESSDAT